MKKVSIVLILNLLLLSGCWDYSEVEDISIASTMAIDIDKDTKEYILNVEITDIEGTSTGINLIPVIVESRGKSLIDAARNMISITAKTPYWSHINIIIIGQDLAREGIAPVLDWIGRNPEARLSIKVFISKEKTAKEILSARQKFTKIRTFEHERLQDSYGILSKLPIIRASRVINQLQQVELFTVLPTVELANIEGKTTSKSIGAAHFKEAKLVGYLDPLDTMKYLFIQDEIEGGVVIIPGNDDERVSLNIYKSKTKIKFEFKGERLYVDLNVKPTVDIAEINGEFDYTSMAGIEMLKEKADLYMKNELETFIKDVQEDIGNDIFAFGNKLKKAHPDIWKSIEGDWNEVFREVEVRVNCDIKIKGSRNTTKPIKTK